MYILCIIIVITYGIVIITIVTQGKSSCQVGRSGHLSRPMTADRPSFFTISAWGRYIILQKCILVISCYVTLCYMIYIYIYTHTHTYIYIYIYINII